MNKKAENKVGQTLVMNNGMKATIVRYGRSEDLDVQFEDGTLVEHKSYSNFKRGNIANPSIGDNRTMEGRVGETRIMNNGAEATIIAYRKCRDIDVKFTKSGYVAKHKSYFNFKIGNITQNGDVTRSKSERIGETRTMNNGMKATIINYKNRNSIDVRFEDGTIVENKYYTSFQMGSIRNPNLENRGKEDIQVGKTKKMNNGLVATITAYKDAKDITVQFEDGVVVDHKSFDNFSRGSIKHPEISNKELNVSRVGLENTMNNGMKAKIINYRTSSSIDIQFEDGTIVTNKTFGAFKLGHIANPNCRLR